MLASAFPLASGGRQAPTTTALRKCSIRAIDFADVLRLALKDGDRTSLLAGMLTVSRLLSSLGVCCAAKESERWRPRQSPPWLGFVADTRCMTSGLDSSEEDKGLGGLPRFPFSPAWLSAPCARWLEGLRF